MAGDWIKVEKSTARKPEVLRIAADLEISPDEAFGLCFRFWSWCDDHLTDGHADGVTVVTLDALIGRAGFAESLLKVCWLQVRSGSLVVPNFDRHLSASAKNRALSGKRQRNKRHGSVTKLSRAQRDISVTREEKRREENIEAKASKPPPLLTPEALVFPAELSTQDFRGLWEQWERHRAETKHPLKSVMRTGQLEMLAGIGLDAAKEMIRHTIAMGLQGLRAPEVPRQATKATPAKDYTP